MKTPIGNIVHFADFRIEYDDAGNPQGLDEFAAIGKMGVHTFMVDSDRRGKDRPLALGKNRGKKS